MKNRAKKNPARRRTLGLERLESRVVLDGGIRAFVSGGNLHIVGDSQDNQILIEQHKSRSFVVSSRDGTTLINGQSDPQTFFGVGKDLDISLGNGDDVVELAATSDDPLWVVNRLSIDTGSGADQVLMTEVHALRLNVNTGSGDDTVNIGSDGDSNGIIVTKEAVILTGSGQDDARIANSLFKRFLTLNMGNNNDETSLQDMTVRKTSTIIGGSGSDTLNRQHNHGKLKFISYERFSNTVTSPAPLPPVAANDTATATRGQSTTINVAANDTSADSTLDLTSIVITQAPTSGTAVANANGTVTYTNNGAAAASDSFQYTIKDTDGNVSNAATVAVTVNAPATLTAVNDTGDVTEDATPNTATGNVLTNDTGGGATKTVSAVNGAAGSVGTSVTGANGFGTFTIGANGAFTYTLDNTNATINALNDGETRTDTVTYTASDGTTTSNATLTITIHGHSDGPVAAVADTGDVTEDATPNTATGNVLTNDTGGTAVKTVSAVNASVANVGTGVTGANGFGTFIINANGTFTYTLDNTNATINALNDGETRTDTVTYTASDGTTNSDATLTLTIHGHTEGALAAVADTGDITEDATPNTATGNVLTNDTGGGATKTVSAVNGAAGSVGTSVTGANGFGTFTINANGAFTYTLDNTNATINALNNGETRSDTVTYTASDGTTTSNATLTITIHGHSDGPVAAVADTGDVTEDATPNTATGNVLTNDTGGTAAKTVSAVNGAAGNVGTSVTGANGFGTFTINANGTFTYTLDNTNATINALNDGETRTDTVTYTASDGATNSDATLTITIHGHTEGALAAVADTGDITEDATPNTATGNVLTNDTGGTGTKTVSAVNGNAANVAAVVQGSHGTFRIDANGDYIYTLNNADTDVNGLNDGQTLPDAVSYTASAGSETSTITLTITIHGHTDAPLAAADDTSEITEDASPDSVTGSVLTNDTGGTGPVTVNAVNGASANVGTSVTGGHGFGTFTIDAAGHFSYTLDNNNTEINGLNDGETRTDSVTYTATDGATTSDATLTITIHGHTDVPLTAAPDTGDITEDATPDNITGNVLDNDTGGVGAKTVTAVNGGSGNVGVDVQRAHGTFRINANGEFTYTLNNTDAAVDILNDGETTTDSITYTVTAGGETSDATLTITIHGHTD